MRRSLILCLLLSGCVSAEERAAQQEKYEVAECTKLGFKPNTEAFGGCRLQLRSIAAGEDSANASKASAAAAAQQNYWNTYNAVTRPYNGYR